MLTLGTEVRAPADTVYGSLDEQPSTETYDNYVESMRERMTTAYEEARVALRRAAERNTKYYGVRVQAKEYRKGQLVYYFNPRKFVGRQDKWERKYTGPFLIVGTPSPVTVQLQRRKGAKTMTIHVDKVKPFFGEVPKSRLAGEPSSEVRELPEKADDQGTLIKVPYNEPDDELNVEPEPEGESVSRIDYEVDSVDHWRDQDAKYEHRST